MALSNAHSGLPREDRSTLLHEIIGIVFMLAALLLLVALFAVRGGTHWTGRLGDAVAGSLDFVFGHYIAWLVPFLIGICGFNALRGQLNLGTFSASWRRGIGGFLVVISSCALLTLSVPGDSIEDAIRSFSKGGLIGNWLVNAPDLNTHANLGRVGSAMTFGALALIGIVLFTEKFVRDLWRLGLSGFLSMFGLTRMISWPKSLPLPSAESLRALSGKLGHLWKKLPVVELGGRIAGWFANIKFTPNKPDFPHRDHPPRDYGPQTFTDYDEHERKPPILNKNGTVFPRKSVPERTPQAGGTWERDDEPTLRLREGEETQAEPGAAVEAPTYASEMSRATAEAAARGNGQPVRKRGARAEPKQAEMELFPREYQIPGLNLLADPPSMLYEMTDEEKERLSRKIEETLAQFKVEVQVIEVIQGPVITRFALRVAPGVRVSRILSLENDLAMALKAQHVRILAPIPGQSAVGIEVPNKKPNPVMLKDLLSSEAFIKHKSPLAFALGKNIAGEPVICDLAQMPHLLIAGTTGSGKSVCLNAIIASFLYKNKPDKVKFVMIDPKRVELSIYQAIPHLIAPVVSETRKAAAALAWCVEQMEERYKLLASIGGLRNIDAYNALLAEKTPNKKLMGRGDLKYLPHIVIIIDELADLMMVARNEVEEYVIRLAQMARAVGMHIIIATQRPSVNVITGIIKANFPSRIAFQVSSKVDSRTILDMNGAEALMGRGDMLYSPGGAKPFRLQGAFVADGEVERLADYIREQEKARYEKEDFEAKPTPAERAKAQLKEDDGPMDDEGDPDGMAAAGRAGLAPLTPSDMESLTDTELYDMALKIVLQSRKASVSYIQRRLKIGYARAGRIMDLMEERGIVGPYAGSKPRELLVGKEDFKPTETEGDGEEEE